MRYCLFIFLSIIIYSCGSSPEHSNIDRATRLKIRQYTIEGKKLYQVHCSNCHGTQGKGLARLIPPVKDSDYLSKYPERSICGIKNGMEGEMEVNGVIFNQPMPGNEQLTNLQIAEILTYIENEFNNEVVLVSADEVRSALAGCL